MVRPTRSGLPNRDFGQANAVRESSWVARPSPAACCVAAAEERRTPLPQRGCVFQPRVARNELPWEYESKDSSTPTGLQQIVSRRMQPFQGWKYLRPVTQGSSFLATLGWKTQPRWGSRVRRSSAAATQHYAS